MDKNFEQWDLKSVGAPLPSLGRDPQLNNGKTGIILLMCLYLSGIMALMIVYEELGTERQVFSESL